MAQERESDFETAMKEREIKVGDMVWHFQNERWRLAKVIEQREWYAIPVSDVRWVDSVDKQGDKATLFTDTLRLDNAFTKALIEAQNDL